MHLYDIKNSKQKELKYKDSIFMYKCTKQKQKKKT